MKKKKIESVADKIEKTKADIYRYATRHILSESSSEGYENFKEDKKRRK